MFSHNRHCHRYFPWYLGFLTNKHDQFNLRHAPHWDICSWRSIVLVFLAGLTLQQSRSCAETRYDIHLRTYISISTGNVRYYLQWVGSRPVVPNAATYKVFAGNASVLRHILYLHGTRTACAWTANITFRNTAAMNRKSLLVALCSEKLAAEQGI
ncbi:hypothetical protein GGP41_007649 [Bipolaris sorokiniana]|uniref:Uncharacterized protein n=1 Tax=Cochliobolus sativus TaxID=45130 RepID=A0A8H5Z8T5_COCSA|nr:hypothetical protein GGP41_007649 [Bipolaris sorokiniana]